MKPTLYSRILLILSGMMLLVAAALTYAAAIRIFPLFSFAAMDPTPPHTLLRPLVIPVLALTASVLLLGRIYQLFSGRTGLLLLLCALLPPIGQYISAEYDSVGTRYFIPTLIFALYPHTVLAVLQSLIGEAPNRRGLRICHRVLFAWNLIAVFALAMLGLSNQILFYQLALLLLTPILPLTVCSQLLFTQADPVPKYLRYDLYALSLLLPLSAFLRPISFNASLYLSRIGLLLLILLPPLIHIFLHLKHKMRKKRRI